MKRIFKYNLIALLLLVSSFSLVGCFNGSNPPKNYNADIQEVLPEDIDIDYFVAEEGVTYYSSNALSLCVSVRGHFMIMDYFSLDGDSRIYDNIYFYKDDYFYMVTGDYKDLFASLKNDDDKEYAEEEKESGYDIQINIIKTGVYKVIFDTKALKFDLVYKSEIDTPKYYTMKNCSIYSVNTNWVEMSVNPNSQEEFYISNFNIATGKTISFFSNIHTSNYIPTLKSDSQKYAKCEKTDIRIIIGGNYNVYINSKTYEVRLELVNVETADYTCVYYNGSEFINLELVNQNVPYIFTYQIEVDTKNTTSVPNFYNTHYNKYDLDIVDSPEVISGTKYSYFKEIGTYKLTINLKTFELRVELLPE